MHEEGKWSIRGPQTRNYSPKSMWVQREEQTTPHCLSLLICKMATVSPTTQLLCAICQVIKLTRQEAEGEPVPAFHLEMRKHLQGQGFEKY